MTEQKKYYVGDVGTEIIVDTGSDISMATVLKLYIKKPSGVEVIWDGTLGPANAQGKFMSIKYVVLAGDWDEGGWWSVQAYIETPGWRGKGETVKFKLDSNFN